MKKLLVIGLMLGCTRLMAQVPIEVKVEQRPSSLGVQSAFEVVVPQANPKDAIELWKKTIVPNQLFKKTPKMQKVKDEWIVNNILISDITTLPLNVITQVSSFPGNIYVRIFFQSEGGFLGSSGSFDRTTEAANKFVRDYAVKAYKQAVEKELKQEENKLRASENDLKKLYRKKKSYVDNIGEAKQDEVELKAKVKDNESQLKNNQEVIQLGVATDVEKSVVTEMVQKDLKTAEKDLNKAQKSISKMERKVNKNQRAQKAKADEIEKQKGKVEEVKLKMDNIR